MNRAELEKLFREIDQNGKGFLDREDLKVASIRLFGCKMEKNKIERIISSYPNRTNQGLTIDQFVDFVFHQRKSYQADPEDENRETFLLLDRTCKGFLTLDDFIRALERINVKIKPETVEAAFMQLDVDGDGRVSYRDFDFMMNYVSEE